MGTRTDTARMNTWERLTECFKEVINDPLTEETTMEYLCLDDLDLVDVMMMVEEEFRISIPDDSAVGFRTVGDVLDFVLEQGERV